MHGASSPHAALGIGPVGEIETRAGVGAAASRVAGIAQRIQPPSSAIRVRPIGAASSASVGARVSQRGAPSSPRIWRSTGTGPPSQGVNGRAAALALSTSATRKPWGSMSARTVSPNRLSGAPTGTP
jgi:hypothetical protein